MMVLSGWCDGVIGVVRVMSGDGGMSDDKGRVGDGWWRWNKWI